MRIAANNYSPIAGSIITVDGTYPYLWFPFKPSQVGTLKNIYMYISGIPGGPTIQWRLHNTMPSSPAGIGSLPVVASGSVTPGSAGLYIQLNSSPIDLTIASDTVLSLTLFRQGGTSFNLATGNMSSYLTSAGLRPMVTRFYRSADGSSYTYHPNVPPWHAVPLQLEIQGDNGTVWDLGAWISAGYGATLSSTSVLSAASFRLPEPITINGLRLLAGCDDTIGGDIQVDIRPLQTGSFYPDMSAPVLYSYTLNRIWLLTASASTTQQVYIPFQTPMNLQNFAVVFRLTSGTSAFSLVGLGNSTTQPISRYNSTMRIVSSSNGGSSWSDNQAIPVVFFDSDYVRLSDSAQGGGGFTLPFGFNYIS